MADLDRVTMLKAVNDALESLLYLKSQLSQEPQPTQPQKAVVDPLNTMPTHLATLLDSRLEEKTWIINPKQYIKDKEVFAKITAYIKEQNGAYVPATNDTPGHWMVPA